MGIYTLSKSGINVGLNKYKSLSGGTLLTKTSNYQPSGTTRVFSHNFSVDLNTTETGSINSVQGSVFIAYDIINNKYRIPYATGFAIPTGAGDPLSNGSGIKMNNIPAMNGVNYTFIAWYKGIQDQSSNITYSTTVPIFGDPRGSVYIGIGINNARISIGSNGNNTPQGSTLLNDEKWHMLTWVYKSNNSFDAYVDGNTTPEISNKSASESPTNNLLDYIGSGYPYNGTIPPNALTGIQIYSQSLTSTQISEIYNAERTWFGV